MNRLCTAVFAAAALVLAVGCSHGDLNIKKGDRFEVLEPIERQQVEVSYANNTTEGGHIPAGYIPKGTVLRVDVTPRSGAKSVAFVPVKTVVKNEESGEMEDVADDEGLRKVFILDRLNRPDMLQYTISLSVDFLDSKLKKLPD
jgi:hypothetical protein